MNYQIWDIYYPGSGFAFAEALEGLDYELENQILFGQQLTEPLPSVKVTKLSAGKLADTLGTTWTGMIVSDKFQKILKIYCPNEIQFIPVIISRYPQKRYAIANILAKIACFDYDRSKFQAYSEPPHAIYVVKKLVLKPIPVEAPALFQVAELPGVILLRDDLREQLQAASPFPGRFIEIKNYKYGI